MQPPQTHGPLAQKLLDTFRPLIDRTRPVALVDYPDAHNAGDHAIWLGEKALLKELKIEIAYQCSMQSYDRGTMARALGNGTVLMHGGGNFGDFYIYHEFRHRLLRDFPDNPVVVLPQTVMFYRDYMLKRSANFFAAHGKVTVATRDALSFHILQKHFAPGTNIIVAPDCAHMLGPLQRHESPNFDVFWLNRTDKETANGASIADIVKLPDLKPATASLGAFADGIDAVAYGEMSGRKLFVSDWYRCRFKTKADQDAYAALDFDGKSRYWLERAVRMLSGGRLVVADRLHAHILCTLAQIPHVLLNNNYGKNFAYIESWSRPLGVCRLASSPHDAWVEAQDMLASNASGEKQRITDLSRWSDPASLHDSWRPRSMRAAHFVPQGATLLDIGCGKMMIENHLPEACRYIPVDIVARDERTLVCDLNKQEYPPLNGVTHISILGVLEYLNDPKAFWDWLSQSHARIILSYVTFVPAFPAHRRRTMGWINDFTHDEIIALAQKAGFQLVSEEKIPPDNVLFVFDPSTMTAD